MHARTHARTYTHARTHTSSILVLLQVRPVPNEVKFGNCCGRTFTGRMPFLLPNQQRQSTAPENMFCSQFKSPLNMSNFGNLQHSYTLKKCGLLKPHESGLNVHTYGFMLWFFASTKPANSPVRDGPEKVFCSPFSSTLRTAILKLDNTLSPSLSLHALLCGRTGFSFLVSSICQNCDSFTVCLKWLYQSNGAYPVMS